MMQFFIIVQPLFKQGAVNRILIGVAHDPDPVTGILPIPQSATHVLDQASSEDFDPRDRQKTKAKASSYR